MNAMHVLVPDPSQHAAQRNRIEEIRRQLPGFRGYLEKEYRRDSDTLARTWIADQLQRSRCGIDAVTRALADGGNIDKLPDFDRLRVKLDHLISRVRSAVHGYSVF